MVVVAAAGARVRAINFLAPGRVEVRGTDSARFEYPPLR
jgi:hypothetical protein